MVHPTLGVVEVLVCKTSEDLGVRVPHIEILCKCLTAIWRRGDWDLVDTKVDYELRPSEGCRIAARLVVSV